MSESTIKRRMRGYNISITDRRTVISDDGLDNIVRSIHRDFPNAGYRRVQSQLACTAQHKCAPAESPRVHAKNGSGGTCNEMGIRPYTKSCVLC